MRNYTNITGKILYSVLFLLIIPLGLWLWSVYTADSIHLPVPWSKTTGWIVLIAGITIMLWGMITLMSYGKGLPMNAFPPENLVKEGPYRIFRHPVYWGFGMLIAGFFIVTQSASGLWLVTPITILGMIALVWGHEQLDLKKRFPENDMQTFSDLPENNDDRATLQKKLAALIWILGILALGNIILALFELNMPFKPSRGFILLAFEYPYYILLILLFTGIVPFLIVRNKDLRYWTIMGIIGLSLYIFLFLVSPISVQNGIAEGIATGISGRVTVLFKVPLFLLLISGFVLYRQPHPFRIVYLLIVTAMVIMDVIHLDAPFYHVVLSISVFLLVVNYRHLWIFLKDSSEKIANSWKEWEFGKVRVINHGFYVGFGAFLGIMLSGILAGKIYAWAILVFAVIVIVFSALWAQVIEGSEKLKRPYGYYGALVGIIFASLAVWFMGADVWVIIGVISVFMPWVQGIGRLRCLVNGCCHGSKVDDPHIGIRYFHYRSRVCGISGLKGEWLHPTPLYAILWLFLVGFVLLAMWNHHCSPPFIFGMYLILTGIGRFVEEAYRGEVQTPIFKGLRLYQWTAILSVLIGIIMTTIHIEPATLDPDFGWQTIVAAIIGGLFTTFAMGIDFPYSNARFSRLV